LAEGHDPWAVPVYCLAEFIRVVTHPHVFTPPSDLRASLDFPGRLLESPTARLLVPREQFWDHLRRACEQADARGNLVFDAQIAAVCLENGVSRLLTFDRDFSRFAGLSVDLV
jgi:uncharacterized protein